MIFKATHCLLISFCVLVVITVQGASKQFGPTKKRFSLPALGSCSEEQKSDGGAPYLRQEIIYSEKEAIEYFLMAPDEHLVTAFIRLHHTCNNTLVEKVNRFVAKKSGELFPATAQDFFMQDSKGAEVQKMLVRFRQELKTLKETDG